jgi:mediator of RNA polymerase II transcription subunit 14
VRPEEQVHWVATALLLLLQSFNIDSLEVTKGEGVEDPSRLGETALGTSSRLEEVQRKEELDEPAMPGILRMENVPNGVNSNHAMAGDQVQRAPMSNGVHDAVNGKPTSGAVGSGDSTPLRNSTMAPAGDFAIPESAMSTMRETAPDIPHIVEGYQPLSKLISRLVQESFRGLMDVIDAMADMPTPQQQGNGFNSHSLSKQDAALNAQKKMKLLNWAQQKHAQFIKVLVLAQWSRRSAEVGRMIDLKVWIDSQLSRSGEATMWMGELKRSLVPVKIPNPDLKTALEVLSTGKASWLPDVSDLELIYESFSDHLKLGYIPPPTLTPETLLKELQNLNTLLHIRLNLHESLPPHFKTFSIKDGRATFVVKDEFEVDLTIADEDPESQLYFIDFRLLFSPTLSELPEGSLRAQLAGKADEVLKSDGLAGLFSLLHETVLTHKIGIFRRQAVEMSRGKWTETVKPEMLRRNFIISYWLTKQSPSKNWIQIGVGSGKTKDASGRVKNGVSEIAVKWVRDGKEVTNFHLKPDLKTISMEKFLKKVIALHTKHTLTSIHDNLALSAPLYTNRVLGLQLSISETEPVDSYLKVQLTASNPLTVAIEPITGQFALQPSSIYSNSAQNQLNSIRDPASEAHRVISNFRSIVSQNEIEIRAKCMGWQSIKSLQILPEDSKRTFNHPPAPPPQRVSYFKRKEWSPAWILAVGAGTAGEDWYIIELFVSQLHYNTSSRAFNTDSYIAKKQTFLIPYPLPTESLFPPPRAVWLASAMSFSRISRS